MVDRRELEEQARVSLRDLKPPMAVKEPAGHAQLGAEEPVAQPAPAPVEDAVDPQEGPEDPDLVREEFYRERNPEKYNIKKFLLNGVISDDIEICEGLVLEMQTVTHEDSLRAVQDVFEPDMPGINFQDSVKRRRMAYSILAINGEKYDDVDRTDAWLKGISMTLTGILLREYNELEYDVNVLVRRHRKN
jgi:hypothetical protein